MRIHISNSSPLPIYEQIVRQIKRQLFSGELNSGDKLPSIRSLAQELTISVITTRRAYEELEKEGFIDQVLGKGSFVSEFDEQFLRDKRLEQIENMLRPIVEEAKVLKVNRETLITTITDLLKEEQE